MENTQEKAQYMAQHFGQRAYNKNYDCYTAIENIMSWGIAHPHGGTSLWSELSVELKPLSSITDDDAISTAKEEFNYFKECFTDRELKVIRELSKISVASVYKKTELAKIEVNNPYNLNIHAIDFLRSKGYALPFRNYSVDQLQEMGWLKLSTQHQQIQ